jgi:hypothetical protein
MFLKIAVEVGTIDKLDDHVASAVMEAEVEDVDEVGMFERRESATFVEERFALVVRGGERLVEDLDGDIPLQRGVAASVDAADGPATDQREGLVAVGRHRSDDARVIERLGITRDPENKLGDARGDDEGRLSAFSVFKRRGVSPGQEADAERSIGVGDAGRISIDPDRVPSGWRAVQRQDESDRSRCGRWRHSASVVPREKE